MLHVLMIEALVEEADVVCDRARQQLVILHHDAGMVAERARSECGQRQTVDQHLAVGGLEQAKHHLHQRCLAAARRTGDRE